MLENLFVFQTPSTNKLVLLFNLEASKPSPIPLFFFNLNWEKDGEQNGEEYEMGMRIRWMREKGKG